MKQLQRALAGQIVGLSISESDDSESRGFPPWQVNRVTLQVVAAFFGQGAGVVFGHDWREDGVMEAIYGFARQLQPPDPISRNEAAAADHPLLQNCLPWPETPALPKEDLERLASTLRAEECGLPSPLAAFDHEFRAEPRDSATYTYVRARGLTHLRHRLNERCHARVCIGGRCAGSESRYPGVIEEALITLRARKPLYLVGILGGASQQVIEAIEGKTMPESFCPATRVSALYESPPLPPEKDNAAPIDHRAGRKLAWDTFRQVGIEQLSNLNMLSKDENAELFQTADLDHAIALILTGLGRLNNAGATSP